VNPGCGFLLPFQFHGDSFQAAIFQEFQYSSSLFRLEGVCFGANTRGFETYIAESAAESRLQGFAPSFQLQTPENSRLCARMTVAADAAQMSNRKTLKIRKFTMQAPCLTQGL